MRRCAIRSGATSVTKLHTALQFRNECVLGAPAAYPDYAQEYCAPFLADTAGSKLEYVYLPLPKRVQVAYKSHSSKARALPMSDNGRLRDVVID
jgi:hypothetical protein